MPSRKALSRLLLALAALGLVLAAAAEGSAPPGAEHESDHHEDDGHSHGGVTEAEYDAAVAAGEDPCAAEPLDKYDLPLHIASAFILLAVSLLGSLGPLVLRLSSRRPAVVAAIRLGSFFGFGTMLATATIHMALPASESFTSACLSSFWTEDYEAWPYLFITVAVLVMHAIDFLIKGHHRRRGASADPAHNGHSHSHGGCAAHVVGALVATGPPPTRPPPTPSSLEQAEEAESNDGDGACPVHGQGCKTLLKHADQAAAVVGVYMADAGIMFHSVMIGLTLGVTSGTGFTSLLIALVLHQFFEGLAIGSAAVDAGLGALRCAALGCAYAITTPVGIAPGIGMRASFNASSDAALLATGILDSLSAGILLYVVLVQLLTPMFTDSDWLHGRRWPLQAAAFAAFYGGAAVMAVIGKWA
ncbi:hypothetical protein ABPG75_002928 [Micractinium tetrahymenae]